MNRFRRSTVLLMALMAAWGWIGSAQLQAHTGHSEQVRQISLQISRHRASHQKKGSSAILVSLLLRRGDMYRRMRRFRRSLRDLREVSRLQPENRQAVLSRAMCFHEMRSYRRARREIDRSIEGGDATGNALILRAQLHQRAGWSSPGLVDTRDKGIMPLGRSTWDDESGESSPQSRRPKRSGWREIVV